MKRIIKTRLFLRPTAKVTQLLVKQLFDHHPVDRNIVLVPIFQNF